MEIIKNGNTSNKYTCTCGCEFRAAKTDKEIENNYFLHKIRYFVRCPECGEKVENSYTDWIEA